MATNLIHFNEFESILSDYQSSESASRILKETNLTLLSAPSGIGRSTIIQELIRDEDYEDAITDTTRTPRVNDGQVERDGDDYYFRNELEVLEGLRQGDYIEAAIIHNQQVSGLRASELARVSKLAKYVVADIETKGAEHYFQLKPDANFIFVVPPDIETWLGRMTSRGQLDQDEISRRLKSAELELQHGLDNDFYTYIVNDDLNQAVNEVRQIIMGQGGVENQTQTRDLTWNLLNQLKRKLYS